ncbi:MAG TPA: hypothetical protein VEY88_14495 [Archangium sp.]|nr:hypothetical protein [Archangium sp.]
MMRIDFDAMRRTLGRPWARRGAVAVGVVVAGAVGLLAHPSFSGNVPMPERAACCTGALAVGDTMISPAVGGDKDFFEVPSSPPNAIFVVGSNESMQDYAQFLPEVGDTTKWGCSDPALVSAMSWFDRTSPDPKVNGSLVYDPDADFNLTTDPSERHFFDPNIFYQSKGRRLGWVVEDFPFSLGWAFRQTDGNTDAQMACFRALRWQNKWINSPELAACTACLVNRGWWRGPLETNPSDRVDIAPLPPEARRVWVLSGRVLNVRPPKFVVARKVLKEVIETVTDIRMGVASFGPDQGWFDPPVMHAKLRPSCDKSFPTINQDELNKPLLKKAVNQVMFNNNERSIGEALFGLGGYYSSQLIDGRWLSWFQQPLNPGWGWPGGWNGGTIDNPTVPGQTGATWGYQIDEWTKWSQPWEGSGFNRSVCFSCQVNSAIVLTDGAPKYDNSVPITKMMSILVANKAKHPDGSLLTFDSSSPNTNLNPGGVNYCDQFEKAPGVKATKEDCDYTDYNWPTGHARTNKNFMDDVAFFLANTDLRGDMPGEQKMRTYTIGYGDNSVMLQSIAMAGGGFFYPAGNPDELRQRIMDALGDLKQTSTSFASANISGVQAAGMNASVYIPRFVPRKNRPYEGHLYRFFFFNEFAQGCDVAKAKATGGDPLDLNRDKDCNDTFFLDKADGFTSGMRLDDAVKAGVINATNIVQENIDGIWVKVTTAVRNADGKLEGGKPAVPFWNLADTLSDRKAVDGAKCNRANPLDPTSGRCIFTLIDKDKDGKFTDADNPPVEFIVENAPELKEYLLSAGDNFCSQLYARRTNKVYTGSAEDQLECAKDVIRHIRGVDVLDLDNDKDYLDERPCADKDPEKPNKNCKLADIFHSTPVTVEPPVDPFLCSLGLSTQCVSTLYHDFSSSVSSMPLCGSGGAPCYRPTKMAPERTLLTYGAYDKYREFHKDYDEKNPNPKIGRGKRDRFVLVGSNGGMLHAIHVGDALTNPPATAFSETHDLGTGQEIWAFIPPDLLSKLGQSFFMHQYYVDGTPMVRDIWSDTAVPGRDVNGIKEPDEFRTLAIITERGGGQRYLALDVTDPYEMLKDKELNPRPFRWMFPNACDPESASMGQSWSNYAPKPPPVGPVRLKPRDAYANDENNLRGWEERWIVMLNGGFSPDLSRGRGLYMVDVWTGEKLWSTEARPGPATGDAYKDLMNQMMPVVASAAMMDIGKAEDVQRDMDGLWDTLVVGDMGGQAWTFRFFEPGERDSADAPIKNWFGARSLEMARDDSSVNGPRNLFQKAPITNIASNVLQPDTGWLRSFMGTGDKQHLRTTAGSDCGPDDLLACVRLKCDVKATYAANVNGVKRTSVIEYVNGSLKTNSDAWSGGAEPVCMASSMDLTELAITCPDATTLGSGSYTLPTIGSQSNCEKAGGQWACKQLQLSTGTRSNVTLSADDKKLVPSHRYFGFHAYGGLNRRFKDSAGAVAFDKLRVTDTPGYSCGTDAQGKAIPCSLVDVTVPSSAYATFTTPAGKQVKYVPTARLNSLKKGTTEGPGWFITYEGLQERTAAGSTVIAGVVSWPTFAPSVGGDVAACSLSGVGDISNLWQADAITGLPDQSEGYRLYNDKGELIGFTMFKSRAASTPPGDPGAVVSVGPSGRKYGWMTPPNPGDEPEMESNRTETNSTPDISWLEVPRNLHVCRHENAALCNK